MIAFSPAAGFGAKWRNPATGKGQSDTVHLTAIDELKQKEEAEENRLLYVAMTRAEDRLILSYAEAEAPPAGRSCGGSRARLTAADRAPDPSE